MCVCVCACCILAHNIYYILIGDELDAANDSDAVLDSGDDSEGVDDCLDDDELSVADRVQDLEWVQSLKLPNNVPSHIKHAVPDVPDPLKTLQAGPLGLFSKFFNPALVQEICKHTSHRLALVELSKKLKMNSAEEKVRYHESVLPEDILMFFGLLVGMALNPGPRLREYWSKPSDEQGGLPYFGWNRFMPRGRFEAIWTNLAFNTGDAAPRSSPLYDRLWKLRPLIDSLNISFSELVIAGTYLSIDEGMVGSKHRSHLMQYMKQKLTKWGFKLWIAADPRTGYAFTATPYIGKAPGEAAVKGLGGKVVLRLMAPFPRGKIVVLDRFFNSPAVALALLDQGHHMLGTCLRTRIGMPKAELAAVDHLDRGDLVFWGDEETGLRVASWKDTKEVIMLATCHGCADGHVLRKDKVTGKKGVVLAPAMIPVYNQEMQGVDRIDHLKGQTGIEKALGTKKWTKGLFKGLLALTISNASILHQQLSRIYGSPALTHTDFRRGLHAQLLSASTQLRAIPRQPSGGVCELKLMEGGKRRRCHLCVVKAGGRRVDTSLWCVKHELAVCGPHVGRDCYAQHTRAVASALAIGAAPPAGRVKVKSPSSLRLPRRRHSLG